MSFEISKVYTENPFVDELVYYTRLMSMDTVLKMSNVADSAETAESVKNGNLYISCIENVASFNLFPDFPEEDWRKMLIKAGITSPKYFESCVINKQNVKEADRKTLTKIMSEYFIENYVELNSYYRMLGGLPPIDYPGDKVENWIPPSGISIDLNKYIHEMDNFEISILKRYGVLESMMEEDPVNRQYMNYLGKKKIDYYLARRANRFDILYIPTIESDAVEKMYRDKLDANKFYVLRTIYSEAFAYNSDYYDNFIAVFIILITVMDVIARVQEFIARKEIFDIRSVQYIFKSYGVPFFEEIPLKYQIAMVKNLHTLLKYKSTSKCMVDICSLFGFKNVNVFKYYILKDRRIDLSDGSYVSDIDDEGNENLSAEYELKFLKLPLTSDLDKYVRVGGNYVDYDEITTEDVKWDGGLDHDMVMKEVLKQEFNFSRTKYMSIDSMYDVAKMSAQQTYFFNFLYDNIDLESLLTVQIPFIEAGRDFNVSDVFTLLTVLTYYYRGVKDTIMDTQSKVLYVNGFNFKADLAQLAIDIGPKKLNNTVVDPGSTLHAQEQLKKFIIPKASIPSFNEMMDIYINNLEVRDELIKGMQEADNVKVYNVYKKLYDALMTVELTMDYYKNPETGDFYRDENGDATYTEYLKHRDPAIYYMIVQLDDFEDKNSRNQYIANLVDSITYAIEEYINSDEFSSLFAQLPVVSIEAVKQYISTVINFYKSYKVDFLGINTIYILDDKNEGVIRLIDGIDLNRFFQKNEFVKLYDHFAKSVSILEEPERIKLIEKMYMNIRTWIIKDYDEKIKVRDEIYEIVAKLMLYTIVQLTEAIADTSVKKTLYGNISLYDSIESITNMSSTDDLGIIDKLWIYDEDYRDSLYPFIHTVEANNPGRILISTKQGTAKLSGSKIATTIDDIGNDAVTEDAVKEFLGSNYISKSDIKDMDEDNPSDEKVVSEKKLLEIVGLDVLGND